MFGGAESLRSSVSFLRAHPVIALSLGAAVVLSLCSVCTGFGAIAGPWFVCELYGAQLASMTGTRRPRGAPWLGASMIFAMVMARTYERAATAIGFVAALPLLPFSIVIGQGILTASYVRVRDRLAPPRIVLARGAPPRGLVVLLTVVIMAPVAALLMLALAAPRECPPVPGAAPRGEVIADRAVAPGRETSIAVRDTTLSVRVRGREVALVAGSDSHGPLPSSWQGDVRRVRVLRDGGLFAIEIHAAGSGAADEQVAHVIVDAAGVRSRDWIRDRLRAWVPTWALIAILAAFAACGVLLVRALAPLGALRAAAGSSPEDPARERADAHRRAWIASLALLPFALAALSGGLVSIGWL